MLAKLTKKVVDAAEKGEREAFIWDSGDGSTKGFGLKITPAGRKVYVFQYRLGGRAGSTKRYTIGEHGQPWTADQAREKAKALQRMVAEGVCPLQADKDRLSAQQAESIASEEEVARRFSVVAEKFISGPLAKNEKAKAEASIIRRRFVARWGDRDIATIRKVDVVAALDAIVDEGLPAAAVKAKRVIGPLFLYAEGRGLIDSSPALRIRLDAAEGKRDRVLSDDELRIIWQAAGALYYPHKQYVRLLMLCGQRRTEVSNIHVENELRLEEALLDLPDGRTKSDRAHVVPLSPEAMAVIEEALQHKRGEYLFTTSGDGPIAHYSYVKEQLDEAIAELMEAEMGEGCAPIPHWTFHDLRRTMRTGMSALKVPRDIAERCLNHKPTDATGTELIYDRWGYLEEKREALEKWGRHVASVVNAPAPLKCSPEGR